MKPMRQIVLACVLALLAPFAHATPPEPPLGKRWVLNPTFSDEFNGSHLDSTKWYDYHPTWRGRPPGIFLPSQVSVKDGFLSITGRKLAKARVMIGSDGKINVYTIAGGAVVSKSTDASFGYYECRFKAAKTTMSTTFWLSTRQRFPGPKHCGDSYGLELDIQECIGHGGDFKGAYFADGMNSNSHFWYTDCKGIRHNLRSPEVSRKTPTLPSDNFYTYGGWWRDADTVSFYLNNVLTKTVKFNASIKAQPFDKPMGLNLVSETYPTPWIPLPTNRELKDGSRNTCYYDWVRSYILIGVDAPFPKADVSTNALSLNIFDEATVFLEKPATMTPSLASGFEISYMCNVDCKIHFELRDQQNQLVTELDVPAYSGYGREIIKPAVRQKLSSGKRFTASICLRFPETAVKPDGDKIDSFSFTIKK